MNFAIIAAGEGSRLAEEGIAKPKPLIELLGSPMIGRLIDVFLACNAHSISVIINAEMLEVREFLEAKKRKISVPLNIVVQSTPSSMHSFYELSQVIEPGKFCLTTVDTIFKESDFAKYIAAFQADNDNDALMAVTPFIDDEKPLYVATNDDLQITAFCDEKNDDCKFVSGGIYALGDKAREVLNTCIASGVSRMRNYQRALIASGLKVKAFPIDKIIDVDHACDIKTAENFISE